MQVSSRRHWARAAVAALVLWLPVQGMAAEEISNPPLLAELPHVADTGYWYLAFGVYLAGGTDWMTTRMFREQGIEEANGFMEPFVDDPVAFAALKVSAGTLVNYASYRLKMNGRRYWAAPQIAWIVLNTAVSVHNHRQLDDE
ncbi:MAG: DUF5658 family protein [Candidatus Polarisedimenticolia bacterium]